MYNNFYELNIFFMINESEFFYMVLCSSLRLGVDIYFFSSKLCPAYNRERNIII